MQLREVIDTAIKPAYEILGSRFNTVEATLMSLAIGGQESKFLSRRQLISVVNPATGKKELMPQGPAVSFWQFERGGGIAGVVQHHTTARLCAELCKARDVGYNPREIWEAMQHDDVLGAGMTRLLLLSDPFKLPAIGKEDEAWNLYIRTWRPGKPHPSTWSAAYNAARRELGV